MKKIIYTILFFLNFYNVFSQDRIKNLSNRDTIYISFDKNESFNDLHSKHFKYDNNETYGYQYLNGDFLYFDFRKKYEVIKKKKSFLSDKKIKLFDIQYFHENDSKKIVYDLYLKKIIIFIIDKDDNNGNKIYLKRVIMINNVPTEM